MIGRTLAQYEITSHLGSGGMGEVYQATDSRLRLAALNHPNIASIHGLEESAGTHFLAVMAKIDATDIKVESFRRELLSEVHRVEASMK